MTVATTLIPGLDEIVRNGNPERRAEAARRIAEMFLQDAAHLRPHHVDLFDGILIDLVVRHSDFDVLIPSHSRIGKLSSGTRISMLLGTPG